MAFYESREVIALVVLIPRVQAFANRPSLAFFTSMGDAHSNRPEAWSSIVEWSGLASDYNLNGFDVHARQFEGSRLMATS